jgi:hypothetical protein
MFGQLSTPARQALANAENAARGLNHAYIGTEHLLLGLIQDEAGTAARALRELGADAPRIRRKIERLVTAGSEPVSQPRLPLTPRAKQAIAYAEEDARILQQDCIGPEHLLIGLMREPEGVARQVLLSLGLKLTSLGERVFAPRLNQLKLVERIVRPVRAGTARKRKMREELLAHLTAIYDQELERVRDPDAALRVAAERFGEPADLTRELESSLPVAARIDYFSERMLGWRAPESAARYLARMAGAVFLLLGVVVALLATIVAWNIGWDGGARLAIRPLIAVLVLAPADVYLIGWLQFKLRDTIFGVFGSRKSFRAELLLAFLIALVVTVSGTTFVAIAEWDLIAAKQLFLPMLVAGIGMAIAAHVTARVAGPTQIRDTMWACLDIDRPAQLDGPPMKPMG